MINKSYIFPDKFTFKENELFHLLNSSLQGRIILGKYKRSKIVNYNKLIDIVIFSTLEHNSVTYKEVSYKRARNKIKIIFKVNI